MRSLPAAVALCLAAGCAPSTTDVIHGVRVPDPYRWLEAATPKTSAWVRARDAEARAFLGRLAERDDLRARIAAVAEVEVTLAPARRGARLFFLRGDASFTHPSLFVSEDGGADGRLLVDGARLAAHGEALVPSSWPSPDGGRVAVCVGGSGSDRCELRVLDVATGTELPDRLPGLRRALPLAAWDARGAAVAWAPAGARRVVLHRMGTPVSADRVLADGDAAGVWARAGGFVVALQRGERSWALTVDGDGRPRVLIADGDGALVYVGDDRGALFYTTRGSPRGRVVRVGADGSWTDVVPEGPDVIETWAGSGRMVALSGDHLYVVYRVAGLAHIRRFDLRGGPMRDIPLRPAGVVWSGLAGEPDAGDLFFMATGFVDPGTVYRLDGSSGRLSRFARPTLPYDASEIVTEAETYLSPSGARVPILLARHRATRADGRRPVLLYGYGWGGWIEGPWFRPHLHEWLRRGGVFALPALRGGGEFGEAWQRAGAGRNRRNGIDDFLAARRWLVASGWTAAERIVAEGQSAGGPLVAAAVADQPDGFAGLLLAHPVIDMLRYEQDRDAARRWRDEYGSVEDEQDFRALLAWAPLQRLRPGVCHPATLLMPGERDPTAAPFHAYKYAAALADRQGCDRPILLRVAWGAGHAYGKDLADTVASYADQLAFSLAATR